MKTLPLSSVLLILATLLFNCGEPIPNTEEITGYNLARPDKTSILPDTLREISGLTNIDSATFACIQDENGIIFIYDAVKNEIRSQFRFHPDGDYEGIARVADTLYVLRSDGTLFEIMKYTSPEFTLHSYATGIPSDNNEGLCYDTEHNRLLIACKGKIGKGPDYKDKRVIYGFDLHTKQLSAEPVFDFDLQTIRQFATEHNVDVPEKKRKTEDKTVSEPFIKFRTSAIGIHPVTRQLYLLSAADHMLFIFHMNGTLEHIEPLSPKTFNKAEGITFYNNGDMLITNEGQDKKPTLLLFHYRKPLKGN